MPPALISAALTAAQDRAPRELLRMAFSLWALLALLALIVMLVVIALLAGRHRRRLRTARPDRAHLLKDAWVEAGRRAIPSDFDEPEPESHSDPPPEGRYS